MSEEQKKYDAAIAAATEALSRAFADRGQVVRSGWAIFEDMFGIKNASKEQRSDMRVAYFAGAQHLWATVISILERDDNEPTARDMRRMELINNELNDFVDVMKRELRRRRPRSEQQ